MILSMTLNHQAKTRSQFIIKGDSNELEGKKVIKQMNTANDNG